MGGQPPGDHRPPPDKFASNPWVESGWDLGEAIGKGSFSTVHVATKAKSRDVAAVKVISKQNVDNTAEIINAEVTVLRDLGKNLRYSSSFVKLRTVYEDACNVYLVMDMCHGGSLADRMAEKSVFSESEARQVARQILMALQELHALNLVHCDIKPENVMFLRPDSLNNLMITDFGLSVSAFADNENEVMGSPHYIAPEVLKRQVYSPGCDVWALGILMYKMLCGRVPFHSNEKIKENKLRFYDDIWATVSAEAKSFVSCCLIKDYRQRPSVSDLWKQPWLVNASDAMEHTHAPKQGLILPNSPHTTQASRLPGNQVSPTSVMCSIDTSEKQLSMEIRSPRTTSSDDASTSSDDDSWGSVARTPANSGPMSALSPDSPGSSPDSTLSYAPPRSSRRHCARRQRKLSIDRKISMMLMGRGFK